MRMDVNNIIIASITNFFRVYVIWRFVNLFFEDKKVGRKTEGCIYGLFYCITSTVFFIYHLPYLNIITNLICLLGITLIYNGSFKKKISVTILIYSINMISDLLALSLFMDYTVGEPTSQVFSIVTDLLILICELIAARLLGREAKKEYSQGVWILLVIPVLSILMLHFLVTANLGNRKLLVVVSIGILMINMVVFYLYHTLIAIHQQLREKEMLEQQIKVYANQIDVIERTQKKVRILRHDIIHHIKELYSLVIRDEKREVVKYLETMEASMTNEKEYVASGNRDIDGILNYMLEKAKSDLAKVEIWIKIPADLNTNTFELTVILGNLLDNAIEAAKQTDEKLLVFKMSAEKGLLFIEVYNKHNKKVGTETDRLVTSKADKANHGLGLESVKEIVDRHKGVMSISHNENNFRVNIMLYLSALR